MAQKIEDTFSLPQYIMATILLQRTDIAPALFSFVNFRKSVSKTPLFYQLLWKGKTIPVPPERGIT